MFQAAPRGSDGIPVAVRIIAPVTSILVVGCAMLGLLVPPLPGPGPLAVWLGHAVRPFPGEMPAPGRPDIWLLPLLQGLALVVLIWRVAVVRSERRAWLLITVAAVALTLAQLLYRAALPLALRGQLGVTARELGLGMYVAEIAFFVSIFGAFSLLATQRMGLPTPALRLDGVIGGCGVLTIGTALLVPDSMVYAMSGVAEIGAVIVAVGALAPAALLIGLLPMLNRAPTRVWWSLLGGILPATAASALTVHPLALGIDARSSPGWLLWPTSLLALAWAAWHAGPPPPRVTARATRSVVTPTVLALSALVVLGVDRVLPQPPVVIALAFLTIFLSTVRLLLALRLAKRLNAQYLLQQESLLEARDEALAASRARSDFSATLSHEIRTPLSAVIGMSELLLAGGRLDVVQREQADHIRRSAALILDLVNDVLDRASIDADQLSLEYQPLELGEVLGDVVELLQVNANAKGIRLQADLDPACPEWVRGDATRLRQVLINLLGNAIKFTDTGEVTVEVCPAARLDAREAIYFQVTDTGSGIPAGQINRLFQPYSRVQQKGARRAAGTGLGLSISQALVQRMGGSISVTSQEGVGSVFGFELVLPPEPMPNAVATALAGRRIAVLDPQPARGQALADRLTRWGAEATVLESTAWLDATADAVILREDHPDALAALGAELAGRAGRPRPHLMIVTASGHAVPSEHLRDDDVVLGATVSAGRLRTALVDLCPEPVADTADDESVERPLRILLAEDDPAARRVGQLMIQLLGHEVDVVADGAAAVEAAADTAYDLVLMDSQLPELDGVEATRAIRENEPAGNRVAIIALSGAMTPSDRERYVEAGMDATLVKPVNRAALQQLLADFPRRPATKSYVRRMVAP